MLLNLGSFPFRISSHRKALSYGARLRINVLLIKKFRMMLNSVTLFVCQEKSRQRYIFQS